MNEQFPGRRIDKRDALVHRPRLPPRRVAKQKGSLAWNNAKRLVRLLAYLVRLSFAGRPTFGPRLTGRSSPLKARRRSKEARSKVAPRSDKAPGSET